MSLLFFFFFQAEDGIRDLYVTGVQTCALPISSSRCSTAWSAERSGPSTLCLDRASTRSCASPTRSDHSSAPGHRPAASRQRQVRSAMTDIQRGGGLGCGLLGGGIAQVAATARYGPLVRGGAPQ